MGRVPSLHILRLKMLSWNVIEHFFYQTRLIIKKINPHLYLIDGKMIIRLR